MRLLPLISLALLLLVSCASGDGTGPAVPAPAPGTDGSGRKEVTLLYPEEGTGLLAPFKSSVEANEKPQEEMTELIRTYLSTAPGGSLVNPFPEKAGLRAFYLRPEGRAVVDLDQWAFDGGGADTETYRIYGIVNTLCHNFPEVRSVRIIVDGQERETLLGHVDLLNPIPPEPSLNGKNLR